MMAAKKEGKYPFSSCKKVSPLFAYFIKFIFVGKIIYINVANTLVNQMHVKFGETPTIP